MGAIVITDLAKRWVTFLRIYIGFVWFAYGTSKLEPGWAAPNGEFFEAAKYGAGIIHGPMHTFIATVVLPNQHIFALLVAYGETLVGISLILGLFTRVGALGGMFLSANYFFAQGKYNVFFGIESIELLLFVCCAVLLALSGGDCLNLDSRLFKKRHGSSEGSS